MFFLNSVLLTILCRKDGDDKSAGRLGDPVCDAYCYDIIGDGKAFISVADGCNWGPKPLEAARIATTTFQESARKNYSKFSNVRETGRLLLRSFMDAHTKILEAPLGVSIAIFLCVSLLTYYL